jgi:ATP adenylyltransferase/5',5'''-P-1,P-4-tetraphosphate phosphorylase II
MELYKVEALLEKYFDGETSIAEERELQGYFSTHHVAPHLEKYTALFNHFAVAKEQQFEQEIPVLQIQKDESRNQKRNLAWISIAASVVVLMGIGTYVFYNSEPVNNSKDLGTYDDPEVAFKETQKALSLLSKNVNVGIESVKYVEEYQIAKNKVFRKTKNKFRGI